MKILIAEYRMYLPESFSLKDKRRIRRSIFDYLKAHYNISIAETDYLDNFKMFQFGLSMVNKDLYYLEKKMQKIEDIIFERGSGRLEILDKSYLSWVFIIYKVVYKIINNR